MNWPLKNTFFTEHILVAAFSYKAENWHALSHEQYFSRDRFLDICRCAFNAECTLQNVFNTKLKRLIHSFLFIRMLNLDND